MTDQRIESLRAIIANLQEYPADQSDDFLAEAMNLAQQLRGLCEAERFHRVLNVDSPS